MQPDPIRVDRFELRRRLGAGGMGVVYEAFDPERNATVALKVMRATNAAALYRFKKEFRVLADLHHPNVVSLYELVARADRWFFTMELIHGVDFRAFVRPAPGAAPESDPETASIDPGGATQDTVNIGSGSTPGERPRRSRRAPGVLDIDRLYAAMRQLATGVAFLHASRCLHRDIKPSNILVSTDGRVVLCDFGLVKELAPEHHSRTVDVGLAGTIAYMSPEQATGAELTEASDWYSVGVMLYEALTGELPFEGDAELVLAQKLRKLPPSPELVNPQAPLELARLAMAMLQIRPQDRPTGPQVLARLGAGGAQVAAAGEAGFVGRDRELAQLMDAFDRARAGAAVTALVRGLSGMGKSALLQAFLDRVRDDRDALVLAGRCYERETVPYKGFDSIVDALSAYLIRLDPEAARALVPRDVMALSRLFPVLRRVDAIEEASLLDFEVPDPQESRRRAVGALRELLRRVAATQPLVLCIDDLQWGDAESGLLIGELCRPPDPPPMLLVLSYRSEGVAASPLLQSLPASAAGGALGEVRELDVGAIGDDDARRLAASILGGSGDAAAAAAIVAEAGGSPFFVTELARYAAGGAELGQVTVDSVVEFRIGQVSGDARAVLAVVAVAGHPVAQGIAARAAALDGDPRVAVAELRQQHLVRSTGVRDNDTLEAYHDRIRESVVRGLDAKELRRVHERLARAYEERGGIDPEILVEHWRGAQRTQRAAHHAAVAAEQAAKAFAFERAARLYRLALELGQLPTDAAQSLRARLGDALAHAGRGAEAAEVYLQAVEGANAADGLELRRRAAECWLHTGHFERGLDAIRSVLGEIGLALAPSPKRALVSLLARRLWLRVRGLGYKPRDLTQVTAERVTRIDILRSVATGLSMIDVIHGADFNTRHLVAALTTGEPHRVARALAVEAAHSSTGGGKTRARTARLAEAAMTLANELDDPEAIGLAYAVSGLGAFLRGEWKSASELCSKAETVLRDRTRGTTWELTNAQAFMLAALFYLGELEQLAQLVPARLREAEERGNLYFATALRSWRTNVAWLAMDDAGEARRQVEHANRQWSREGFHLQHYYELLAHGQIDLYEGNGAAGLRRLDDRWPALAGSLLLRVQNIRVEAHHLRARCALAEARATGDERLITRATDAAARMDRERMPWASALAGLVRAGAAAARGDASAAAAQLETVAAQLAAADMRLYAAVAGYRRAQLTDGDVPAARAAIARMGARNPARIAAMLAPGFADD